MCLVLRGFSVIKIIPCLHSAEQFLKSDVNTVVKKAFVDFTKNDSVHRFFSGENKSDIGELCLEYMSSPRLYDDVFAGRIKYKPGDLVEKPIPVFNDQNPVSGIKQFLSENSLLNKIVKIFDAVDGDNNLIKRISMKMNGKNLQTVTYDSKNRAVDEFLLVLKDEEALKDDIFIRMLNASDEKRVDLYRD